MKGKDNDDILFTDADVSSHEVKTFNSKADKQFKVNFLLNRSFCKIFNLYQTNLHVGSAKIEHRSWYLKFV